MKTLNKYIFTLSMVLLSISCNQDIVNLENPNQITSSSFWQTPEDAFLGTNAIYQALTLDGTYMRKYQWTMDTRADDCYNMTPVTYVMTNLTNYTIGGEELEQPWECHYTGIWRANQLLKNIDGISDLDEATKNQYKGEAKFLRGLFYFNLLNLFQNVVLHKSAPESVDDFYKKQSPPEEVWEFVYQDLSEAITLLPLKENTDPGRATKGAAAGLLAKAYLMNSRFSDAAPVLKDVISAKDGGNEKYGLYDLVPDYGDNFTETNENNIESLFEIQFDMSIGSTQGWIGDPQPDWQRQDGYVKGLAPRPIGWGDIAPTPFVFNEFQKELTIDGKLDPRMESCFFWPHPDSTEYKYWGWPQDTLDVLGWTFGTTGRTDLGIYDTLPIFIKKYANLPAEQITAWMSGINRRIIRYADILLMYGECLNELGQTNEAYSYIQIVRNRARLDNLPNGLTQADMREQIRHERLLELCFETWRYIDLLRWGFFSTPESVETNLLVHDLEFLNWQPGREYLAIPPTEIERTNGNVIQNDAWK